MITEMPIVQPYFIPNNNEVFEKLSMTKWVIENGTNPMTGEEMSYTELVEHNNKKEILRKIIEKNKEIFPSIDTSEIENINKN
jgi:phosphoribosyl-ATP pyrophosphohydrolase